MDTGDLSEETYRAIMSEAEGFNHDLTLQFGLLSGECKNEEDFIEKSLELIKEMKKYDEIDWSHSLVETMHFQCKTFSCYTFY